MPTVEETHRRLDALPGSELEWRFKMLEEQQAAITRALACMNDGRWLAANSGADSVEAWLISLNPTWDGHLAGTRPLYVKPTPPPIPPSSDVEWYGSPNYTNGRAGMKVIAIVIHTMAGSLSSCDNWFRNSASQVSSHFGIGLSGEQHQYVNLQNSSWANGRLEYGNDWTVITGNNQSPNYQTVTIETEDKGSGRTAVTEEQYEGTLNVCRIAMQKYPSIKYLFGHRIISPGTRPQCCGDRWWNSGRYQAIANELGLEAYY
jgi:hypothetical protein